MRASCLIFLFIYCCHISAQRKNHLNAVVGFGPMYIFNDPSLARKLGHSEFTGLNYQISNKQQNMSFVPAIYVQWYTYRAEASPSGVVEVGQDVIATRLDVLMKVQKLLYIRVGLFFQKVFNSSLNFIQKDLSGNAYYGYGNEELEKGYSEAAHQAGFCFGLSIPFKLFNNLQKFNITYNQIASSVVESNYIPKSYYGDEVHVLSVKARPSLLTLGFDINLAKNKKKKTQEE